MPMYSRARLSEVGWARPLTIETAELPAGEPSGTQVLIDVEACGVCHRDLIDREGRIPFLRVPITPGHEAVGRVAAVGPNVTRLRAGDRVATMHRDSCQACPACAAGEVSLCERAAFVLGILADGGYASRLLAPESCLYEVPAQLSAPAAAVQHCTFGTAYRGLKAAGTRAGATVLVTGANGGVGVAAVQIARRLGARVLAVVRDARHRDLLTRLGAHEVIVDADGAFHKRPEVGQVDVAMDCVGQPTFNAALRSLRLGGRLVAIGNIVAARVELNLGLVIVKALRILGSSGATPSDMAELFALAAAEPFETPIAAVMDLSQADQAQRLVARGGLGGRVVLQCG